MFVSWFCFFGTSSWHPYQNIFAGLFHSLITSNIHLLVLSLPPNSFIWRTLALLRAKISGSFQSVSFMFYRALSVLSAVCFLGWRAFIWEVCTCLEVSPFPGAVPVTPHCALPAPLRLTQPLWDEMACNGHTLSHCLGQYQRTEVLFFFLFWPEKKKK